MSISRKTSNYCNNAKLSVGRVNGSVLPFSYTNADFSIRMGKRFSLACFDVTMQSPMFGWATVLHFFFDIIMQSSLLGRGTVPSRLFRYNNAEFSIRMENDSVLPFSIQRV